MGGSRRGEGGGGRSGRVGWGGGVQVGQIGVVGGDPGGGAIRGVGRGGGEAPLTSSCPPSNHTITINRTLTFAAS